ncbi:hypothetical protein CYMTET_12909 [Cymbomonas tetramitiformis]|uniref:Uncharacterized protein n=1 Tax=Cymbomonas tetramitiformis TaxID=36881 RepID=A0AAE0LBD5_9CHLO|nr:hypothetical protein CYMTET_12909 [Cymbomonas tetramitiformis]
MHSTVKGVLSLLRNRYTMIQNRAGMESGATVHGGAEALRPKLATGVRDGKRNFWERKFGQVQIRPHFDPTFKWKTLGTCRGARRKIPTLQEKWYDLGCMGVDSLVVYPPWTVVHTLQEERTSPLPVRIQAARGLKLGRHHVPHVQLLVNYYLRSAEQAEATVPQPKVATGGRCIGPCMTPGTQARWVTPTSTGWTDLANNDGDDERLDMNQVKCEVVNPAEVQQMGAWDTALEERWKGELEGSSQMDQVVKMQGAGLSDTNVGDFLPKAAAFMQCCVAEDRLWLTAMTEMVLASTKASDWVHIDWMQLALGKLRRVPQEGGHSLGHSTRKGVCACTRAVGSLRETCCFLGGWSGCTRAVGSLRESLLLGWLV